MADLGQEFRVGLTMAAKTIEEALAALEQHKAVIGEDVLAAIHKRFSERSPEDHREAAKLAAETAKMILTVDVAGLVAIGTFVQFARNGGVGWYSWTMLLFGLALFCGVCAAGSGFVAIANIYKRADGRTHEKGPAWSTETPRGTLNLQALASFAALALLLGGIAAWAGASPKQRISAATAIGKLNLATTEPLTITGKWDGLRVEGASKSTLMVGKDEPAVTIACW